MEDEKPSNISFLKRKPTLKKKFISIESMEDEKSRNISFLKRKPTLKKFISIESMEEEKPRNISFLKRKPTLKKKFSSIESMEDEKSRNISFLKREPTLKKKAQELAKLCDVSVCLLCYAPDGKLDIWPEDQEQVNGIISRYEGLGDKEKHRQQLDLTSFVDSKRKKIETKKMKKVKKRLSINWDERLDVLSREKLTCFDGYLDSTLQILKEKEARAITG